MEIVEECIHVLQALEFTEARELVEHSLEIHSKGHSEAASVDEAADHRLLAIIYSAQGEHNKALESLVYANEIFVNFDHEVRSAHIADSLGSFTLWEQSKVFARHVTHWFITCLS